MKLNNYLLIFFLFLNLFVSAQFEKIIEHKISGGDFNGGLALETSTGDYIILTEDSYSFVDGDSVNINMPVSLFKISQNGNIIDSIHFPNINLRGDLININDNKILITGSFRGAFQDTFLSKPALSIIDENLNIISIDTLDLPTWLDITQYPTSPSFTYGFFCKKILPTKTGNFLATTRNDPSLYSFYELNSDFDTIQTKKFFNNSFGMPIFINNRNDSSFYVFSDLDFYKVDKNLEFTYIKSLNTAVDNDIITRLITVKYLNDNRILMYFGANVFYPETNSFDKQIGVYIVDTLFNLHNYVHLGYSKDTLDMPVGKRNGIDFIDPNNIFCVNVVNHSGYYYMPEMSYEISYIMVSVLDSNLNIKNQTFYGGDDKYLPCDIKATSDGGCLIVSSKYEINSGNDYSYVHLLKVNENGELNPQISNEEINNSTMKLAFIYPNPSKDFINVRYGAHLKNVSIEIFDISGKKIFVKNLKNPISRIDIQNLKIGSYVYHILNDNKIIEKGKIIKE